MDDQAKLARQMFAIGCFGLPWLWLLNAVYFYPSVKDGTISAEATIWVHRSFFGSALFFSALVVWVITFQTSWRSWSGATDYMVNVPDEDVNTW